MASLVFDGEVSVDIQDGVARIIMTSTESDGAFEWGTKREEHRWNPIMVSAVNQALDAAENNPEVCVVVVGNRGKFWSNGMDLKWLDFAPADAQADHGAKLNSLMARICTFPLPTIAAMSGHWAAAGGMMGLAFDFRVMSSDRGYFFIPGVDLGLVYAPLQIALMKGKLPPSMQRDVIVYNIKKWNASELQATGAVDAVAPSAEVQAKALELAEQVKVKGRGAARKAMGPIKRLVYKDVVDALQDNAGMGYGGRTKGVDRFAPSKL